MSELTIQFLIELMSRCAGADGAVSLDAGTVDKSFDELGYDSLAILEATGALAREFGVSLPDDVVSTVSTPAELVDLVNAKLTEVV